MSAPPVLHLGVGATKCRTCQTPIVFATTASGKSSPFEADPAGHWTIENGKARYLGAPAEAATQQAFALDKPVPRFTSHFAKCPQASSWRNRGE